MKEICTNYSENFCNAAKTPSMCEGMLEGCPFPELYRSSLAVVTEEPDYTPTRIGPELKPKGFMRGFHSKLIFWGYAERDRTNQR